MSVKDKLQEQESKAAKIINGEGKEGAFRDLLKKQEERAEAILSGEREDGGFHKVLEAVDDKVTNRYNLREDETERKRMLKESKSEANRVILRHDVGVDTEDAKLIQKAREDAYAQHADIDPDGKVKEKIKEIEDASSVLLAHEGKE